MTVLRVVVIAGGGFKAVAAPTLVARVGLVAIVAVVKLCTDGFLFNAGDAGLVAGIGAGNEILRALAAATVLATAGTLEGRREAGNCCVEIEGDGADPMDVEFDELILEVRGRRDVDG